MLMKMQMQDPVTQGVAGSSPVQTAKSLHFERFEGFCVLEGFLKENIGSMDL